jgi:threonine dehydrogenase-like Zn-dependent dehydrogenase
VVPDKCTQITNRAVDEYVMIDKNDVACDSRTLESSLDLDHVLWALHYGQAKSVSACKIRPPDMFARSITNPQQRRLVRTNTEQHASRPAGPFISPSISAISMALSISEIICGSIREPKTKLYCYSQPHAPLPSHFQTMAIKIPSTYRALQLDTIGAALRIVEKPMLRPDVGSAIVRIEVAEVLSYHREVYNGKRQYSFPTPIVGGINAIGRITALGPDAASLAEDQLVYVDCVIHARDDPDTLFLSAIHDSGKEGSKKLMRDIWRDGVFAEYAKVPLENCIPLDETVLCKELGYSVEDLMYIGHLMVPFGGLRDIGLEPGETVIVCPATGGYGGAGVQVAIAMGARVIAMGRNEDELARLRKHVLEGTPDASIEIVKISGDEADDFASLQRFGVIDAVLDFTPPQASKTTHTRAATSALRRNGRAILMGFVDQPIVPWHCVGHNITLKGKLMYERGDIAQLIKMLQRGLFPRTGAFATTEAFGIDVWKAAFIRASQHTGIGRQVVLKP